MVRRGKEAIAPTEKLSDGSHISVTAQQSRYALDAVDAPASKEILVKDLSISVSNRELLSHVNLHLVSLLVQNESASPTKQ
jgi:ATP-binding cassette subfamily F protein 3